MISPSPKRAPGRGRPVELSDEQHRSVPHLLAFRRQVQALGEYAGTGKCPGRRAGMSGVRAAVCTVIQGDVQAAHTRGGRLVN
jgi:hypothetical protein